MQAIKKILGKLIGILFLAAILLASTQPSPKFFPAVQIEAKDASGALTLSFLFDAQITTADCDAMIGNVVRMALGNCNYCSAQKLKCSQNLSPSELKLFSDQPLDVPSGRMTNGVVTFISQSPELALASCQAAQSQSLNSLSPIKCHPANEQRSRPTNPLKPGIWWLILLTVTFTAAWTVCWFIVRYEHLHAHLTHDHIDAGPQKYHAVPTPRIGGLAIIVALLVASSLLSYAYGMTTARIYGILLLASAPAFFGGLLEDITKQVGVMERLLLTMLSGAVSAWLLGVVINRLDIPYFDTWLTWLPFAVLFTSIAVGGIANAVNIIDGYNGLAPGFAVIVLIAIGYVGIQVGDAVILSTAIILAGSLIGFFVWNWPKGKIFMGDGGAYLVGFMLAQLSILTVIRNPEVSPWFPLQLMIYPVFETFFSIYRRKIKHNISPGNPDNQHLHQLVHDRLIVPGNESRDVVINNSKVAKYFWLASLVIAASSSVFYRSSAILIGCSVIYCVVYVVFYNRLKKLNSA